MLAVTQNRYDRSEILVKSCNFRLLTIQREPNISPYSVVSKTVCSFCDLPLDAVQIWLEFSEFSDFVRVA